MVFEPITFRDLDQLAGFQPDDWPDIVPEFEFYIRSPYCEPIKTEEEGKIVGIGALITYDTTCWVGHMIVHKDFRNQGIGYQVLMELLAKFKEKSMDTCLLIASELGRPVYLKAGFRDVTEYVFMQREKTWKNRPVSKYIIPLQEKHLPMIYDLDRKASGENREELITEHLKNVKVYFKRNMVHGFYLPELKEGLIIADTEEAGISLMEMKYSTAYKAALPSGNIAGVKFLKENGFVKREKEGTRMIYGKDIHWEPKKIYSRIGGNFG